MFFQHLKRRLGCDAVYDVVAEQRRLGGRRVVSAGDSSLLVPNQWFPSLRLSQITAIPVHQIGAVRLSAHKRFVVYAKVVEKNVQHREREGAVGAGPDRKPLVGL